MSDRASDDAAEPQDRQWDWTTNGWVPGEVGEEPERFAVGIMGSFVYLTARGEDGEWEFFTFGSNPGLDFGDPEWLFAQDDPDYVVACLADVAPVSAGAREVVDRYLSRLDDVSSRGSARTIIDELIPALGLPALPIV